MGVWGGLVRYGWGRSFVFCARGAAWVGWESMVVGDGDGCGDGEGRSGEEEGKGKLGMFRDDVVLGGIIRYSEENRMDIGRSNGRSLGIVNGRAAEISSSSDNFYALSRVTHQRME